MRDSSYYSSNQQTTQNFSQGGEKKVMKKSLSVLLSAAVAFGSFASLTSAAELTAQEKFDALKAKGIFTGVNAAGDAGLDQTMNRAQFARVAALLLGLEGIGAPDTLKVTEKPFPDVDLGKWYTEEVAAVKAAKVLVGNSDGTFNPEGNISVQELAVVAANLLGLTPVADASVEGAASWAAGYIKAIQNAGVSFPTNYTEAATREQLVNLSFQANAVLNPDVATIASTKQTGAKKIAVAFNGAVDTSKAVFAVKRGSITVNISKTTWSDDKKTATLEGFSNLVAGDYTVSVTGLSEAALTGAVKVEDSKVTSIAFKGDSLVQTAAAAATATVDYTVKNQFGEEVNGVALNSFTSAQSIAAANGTATVTFAAAAVPGTSVATVTLADPGTGVSAAGTFKVADPAKVASYEFGELKNKDNKVLRTNTNLVNDVFQFDVVAKNQYGTEIGGAAFAAVNTDSLISTSNANLVAGFINDGGKLKLKLTQVPAQAGTYTIIVVSKTTGKSATLSVKVEGVIAVKSFTLLNPSDLFIAGSTTVVPFEAVDQYGNKLTKFDDINPFVSLTESDTNVGTTFQFVKNPVTGEATAEVSVAAGSTVDQTLFLTSLVTAEAKTSSVSGKVNAAKKPVRIAGLKSDSGVVTKLVKGGAQTTIDATDFQLKDQYENNIDISGTYTVRLTAADDTFDSVTNDVYILGPSAAATATVTSGANAGAETYIATLYDNGTAVANSAVQFTISSVEKSAIASYVIDTADKVFAPTGAVVTAYGAAGAANQAYAKDLAVYGKDADGVKIGLKAADVVNTSSTNAHLQLVAGKIYAQGLSDAAKEESATIVVTVNGANGTATATKTVTLTNAARTAGAVEVKAADGTTVSFKDGVAVLTVANTNLLNGKDVASNIGGTTSDVYFEVKDQYGVASSAVAPSFYTLSAVDAAGNAKAGYSITGAGSITAGGAASGDVITITAIMNDGATKVLKVVVQ